MQKVILFIIFCITFLNPVWAVKGHKLRYDSSAIQKRQFNESVLREYLQSGDFDYEPVEESSWSQAFADWLKGLPVFDIDIDGETIVNIFKVIEWMLIIGAVLLLLYALLKMTGTGMPFVKQPEQNSMPGEVRWQEALPEEELRHSLEKAVQEQDYRRAVRLQYFLLLKQLDKHGIIRWRSQKTNREFVREVAGSDIEQAFRRFVRRFNYVWYGHFQIDQQGFERLQEEVRSIEKALPEGP